MSPNQATGPTSRLWATELCLSGNGLVEACRGSLPDLYKWQAACATCRAQPRTARAEHVVDGFAAAAACCFNALAALPQLALPRTSGDSDTGPKRATIAAAIAGASPRSNHWKVASACQGNGFRTHCPRMARFLQLGRSSQTACLRQN